MQRNTSVSLGDHFVTFIDEQVGSGRYGSASDVVRAGLRLLEEQEMRLQTLRDALIAGEESGPPKLFDGEAFLKRLHDKHAG
ncbi:type II toxin-antitoxin system ParD family antitoxin [Labrys sp. LIt4]|uniref:type II toxin-antitoxin system ParD family antitoxin n=1 Tax=Labrys sp. LIt4 TaxID=2821355 RepID=UPI001ADFA6D5|nr:type II toxin-antitoxin system ParD family antitoxin [Labrys sp. LIt4]MBP0580782.1 type II toxin-antitoxin system ParD family antitoxin [Labrys sp. LIt4]